MFLDRFKILCIGAFMSIWLIAMTTYRTSLAADSWNAASSKFLHLKHGTEDLKPGELLIVTASSGENGFLSIPGIKDMVYEDRMSYANQWGYDHMWADISSYSWGPQICWNKIPILQDALIRFPKAKWIWWLDMDIIIMNHTISMYDHVLSQDGMMQHLQNDTPIFLPGGDDSGFTATTHTDTSKVNFLVTTDTWGINLGSFLVRRSEWLDIILDMWVDPMATSQDWTFAEQDGWVHMVRDHKIVKDHTGFLNQRSINSYPSYNGLGAHYEPGDLLVHFAGCGSHPDCPKHWEKYWHMRGSVEVPEFIEKNLEEGTAEIENIRKNMF